MFLVGGGCDPPTVCDSDVKETRMQHRGRISLLISFCLALVFAGSATAQQDQQDAARRAVQVTAPTEIQIWKAIIADSIASYPQLCPCPYSRNRAGRTCGERSAYTRVASATGRLMCFPQDIPEQEIARYRERLQQ
jgi:hypothetical protein